MAGKKPSSSKAKGKEPMASSEEPPSTQEAASENMKRYAVELYFDDELNRKILSPTNNFRFHNISSKYHNQGWKPSIILIQNKHIDPQDFREVIETFAITHEAIPIQFLTSSLLVRQRILNAHSVFLAPVPSIPLLVYHNEFCQMVKRRCFVRVKGSWVPLCPIGFDVPETQLVRALNCAFITNFLYKGYVTSIGLAEFSSNRRTPLFSFNLRGA